MKQLFIFVCTIVFFVACSSEKKEKKEENVQQILPETPTEVTTEILKTKTFSSEIVSNGKLTSENVAALRFQINEPIAEIYVKNGEKVEKGQVIATLQSFSFENKLREAKGELQRAKLELQDILIGQGYKLNDTASIAKDVMQLAMVKSGYSRAVNQYKNAQYDKTKTELKAPFSGVVANITDKKYMMPTSGKPFCNIVDMHKMIVEFSEIGRAHV